MPALEISVDILDNSVSQVLDNILIPEEKKKNLKELDRAMAEERSTIPIAGARSFP